MNEFIKKYLRVQPLQVIELKPKKTIKLKVKKDHLVVKKPEKELDTNMKFVCLDCNFATNMSQNFFKHANTDKHKLNIHGKYICEFCCREFNSNQAKHKHKKTCVYKK
jgi:hypothetical protein